MASQLEANGAAIDEIIELVRTKATGVIPVVEGLVVTANGTYEAPDGVHGYSPVNVNVPIPEPVTDTLDVTENGTYTAPDGTDGYSPVTVNVQPKLQEKSVTPTDTEQIITPDSGFYGLSSVKIAAAAAAPVYTRAESTKF